jgi:thiol-disulfide isomerase/thioredoxin
MKNLVLIFASVWLAFAGRSQTTTLAGQSAVKNLQLTLLYGDGQYKTSEIQIAVSDKGRFKQVLSLPYPVFAVLRSDTWKRRLLLSPGRDLLLNIYENDVEYTGRAAAENKLVRKGILDSAPFFTKGYTNITLAGFNDSIMNRVEQKIAGDSAVIKQASIPESLKQILTSETRYAYQCYLNDFTVNDLRWQKNKNADSLASLVMQWQPMPDSLTLVSGYYANMMLQKHGRYELIKLSKNKAAFKETVSAYLDMPFDTVDSLIKIYGESAMLNWLYARNQLPAAIADKMIFNSILEAADANELSTARFLVDKMPTSSNYLANAKLVIRNLENAIESHASNKGIRFNRAAGINSLQELVKPYAGKVVYIDIWGTWCGPCREEMRYAKELKKRFAGKEVVFLYLDKDDAPRENTWKEYVHAAGLEGEHYRMNNSEIDAIWDAIKKAGNERTHSYPTYVIIDKKGNIIHPSAERPSSREKLYAQLDKML